MPATFPRLEATAATPESAPSTPICVRSRSLRPLDVPASAQAGTEHPPQQAAWPQEPISPPYATPSFTLDPALCGHTFLLSGSQNGVQVLASPMSSSPNPVSRLAIIPPQFQAGGAIHLLSQQYVPNVDPRVDPRMLQQLPSEYGSAFASRAADPQLLYNYQLAAAEQRGQSIGWSARDLVLRSPPLPRQRSAKACKKCRMRKTKCSGGQPCTRCVARGLECEYDEKSTLRGPLKSRAESRGRKSGAKVAVGSSGSRSRSRTADKDDSASPSAHGYTDKIPSVMQPAPASATIAPPARDETPQPFLVHTGAAHALDGSASLGGDPAYAQLVGRSLSDSACAPDSAEVSLIQGYVAPDDHDSVLRLSSARNESWLAAPGVNASDVSDTSRPPSACSDYSQSSSDASGYTLSSDASFTSNASPSPVAWPAMMPRYDYGRPFPTRMLSSSLSSSSLKDALVPRPRRRAFSQASPLAAPDAAHALSSVLRHASLADSEGAARAPAETLLLPGAPGLLSAPPRATLAWGGPHSQPPTPADALRFEDVFNFAPESPVAAPEPFDALASRGNTLKARDAAHAGLGTHAFDATYSPDGFIYGAPLGSPADIHHAAFSHA
ncbi:hypothetical protein PsYK624_031910 [Phanerochaete sordida]|uniref:Zn(2)-C6 fungal-type domain-containing protein n=1 Tax=Phanerochaete sordida TaxID=48140 RepID=A0A9P3G162_9APHY|nr:hypothetical protein PsYK624_031910 [Phanerochaete sordida]